MNCPPFFNMKEKKIDVKKISYDKVADEPYFKTIKTLVGIFEESGMIFRSAGHCMAMSDLVQKLLFEQGIESHLVECTLSVISRDEFVKLNFLGHDTNKKRDQMEVETHVVCITKTKVPILIDLSIGFITKDVSHVVHPIFQFDVSNEDNIVTIDLGNTVWIYNKRKISNLPQLHERSILDRIITDNKIDKSIKLINKILIVISILTTLNFARGIYDFYQKYINKTNGFGPVPVQVDKTIKN